MAEAISESKHRMHNAQVLYPYNGDESYSARDSVHIMRNKLASQTGDKVKSLPFHNSTAVLRGSRTYEQYRHKVVNGQNSNVLYIKEIDQPFTPKAYYSNAFCKNTLDLPLNEPRFYHGNYALADKRALKRLKQQKINTSVLVAEAAETVAYFSNYALRLARATRSIRTGKYSSVLSDLGISKRRWRAGSTKTAGQRFLEWKFAILPLIHDVQDIQQLMKDKLKDLQLDRITVRGRHTYKFNSSSTPPAQWGEIYTGPISYKQTQVSQTVRTKLYGKLDDLDLLYEKAVGLDDIYPALWELVPFSWLVDYVVDIGTVLETYSASRGVTFIDGSHSTRTSGSVAWLRYWSSFSGEIPTDGYGTFSRSLEKHEMILNGYVRDVIREWPRPRLSFVLPDLSGGRIANVIALALSFQSDTRKAVKYKSGLL